jgi:hypothetical protein
LTPDFGDPVKDLAREMRGSWPGRAGSREWAARPFKVAIRDKLQDGSSDKYEGEPVWI